MSVTNIAKEKHRLRKVFTEKLSHIPQRRKDFVRHAAYQQLSHLIKSFRRVCCYASLDQEVSTWDINLELASKGALILPRVIDFHLELFHVESIETDLEESYLGILEPKEHCPRASLADVDCLIIPGLAFDRNGNRLGKGRGHYDRLLSGPHTALKVGLCFEEQFVDLLPIEDTDQSVDKVLFF